MKIKKLQNNKSNNDSKIILFAVFILLISIVSFNFTGITGAAVDYESASRWLIGNLGTPDLSTAGIYIVYFIILVMLAAAFTDIFMLVTPFSSGVSWVLGIGLALIAALTGFVRIFAQAAFSGIAAWGTFVVVAVLAIAFLMFLLASPIIAKLKIQKKVRGVETEGIIAGAGIRGLSLMAKEALGIPNKKIPWPLILLILALIVVIFVVINLM